MALNDTCDCELWDKDGFTGFKESQKLDIEFIMRDPKILSEVFSDPADRLLSEMEKRGKLSSIVVYQGIITGSKEKLESELSQSIGRKIIVIPK